MNSLNIKAEEVIPCIKIRNNGGITTIAVEGWLQQLDIQPKGGAAVKYMLHINICKCNCMIGFDSLE